MILWIFTTYYYWLTSRHTSQCNVSFTDEKESLNRCTLTVIGPDIYTCTIHECATLQRVQLYRLPSAVEIVVCVVGFDGKVLDALEVRRVGAGTASNAIKLLACTVQHAWEVLTYLGICDKAH